jgi:hypothetical protein
MPLRARETVEIDKPSLSAMTFKVAALGFIMGVKILIILVYIYLYMNRLRWIKVNG